MTVLIIIALLILGFCILLRQVLKSNDDIDLMVSIRKGEMNVKKKKSKTKPPLQTAPRGGVAPRRCGLKVKQGRKVR
jgi:hypothetical protein